MRPTSLDSPRYRRADQRLVSDNPESKIGAKVVSHGRYIAFKMAEVAISRGDQCSCQVRFSLSSSNRLATSRR
jgi:plastocyanin